MKNFMGKILGQKRSTANMAKERLQILISRERAAFDINQLQQDLVAVIAKHVSIAADQVEIKLDRSGELLELNIMLPESAQATA